jgi:hypothetical protein
MGFPVPAPPRVSSCTIDPDSIDVAIKRVPVGVEFVDTSVTTIYVLDRSGVVVATGLVTFYANAA